MAVPTDLLDSYIQESISGLMSERRVQARSEGIVEATIIMRVPLPQLFLRVQSRLDVLRQMVEQVDDPTIAELGQRVVALGYCMEDDQVVVDVHVPPPRRAHAR